MNTGLIVFVMVVVLNLSGLLLDLVLWLLGLPTVSSLVWRHAVVGYPIVLLQVAGLIGLYDHFYGR